MLKVSIRERVRVGNCSTVKSLIFEEGALICG